MFLSVFESLVGLMMLYSVTSATNTINYHVLQYTEQSSTQPIHTYDSGYVQEDSSSGSSVTFVYEDSSVGFVPSNNTHINYWTYRICSEFDTDNNTFTRAGSLTFYLKLDNELNKWVFNVHPDADDIFNLETFMYLSFTDSNGTFIQSFNCHFNWRNTDIMLYNADLSFETLLPADFFDDGYSKTTLTIMNVPVDMESWTNDSDIYDSAYSAGFEDGRQTGFGEGVEYYSNIDTSAVTIFSGIVTIGLLPINFFLAMLNFEVFGINIGGLVAGFMTLAIVIMIVRIIFSGGNGGDSK